MRTPRAVRIIALSASTIAAASLSGCNNAGEGALFGAGLGAGGGAIIGSIYGEAGAGAAIGAVAGALVGGVIGDQNQRNASYHRSDRGVYETRVYHYDYRPARHVCYSGCGCRPVVRHHHYHYRPRPRNWNCY